MSLKGWCISHYLNNIKEWQIKVLELINKIVSPHEWHVGNFIH